MATKTDLDTATGRITTDVKKVADDITALQAKIAAGGTITAADLDPSVTALNAAADALEASDKAANS